MMLLKHFDGPSGLFSRCWSSGAAERVAESTHDSAGTISTAVIMPTGTLPSRWR